MNSHWRQHSTAGTSKLKRDQPTERSGSLKKEHTPLPGARIAVYTILA